MDDISINPLRVRGLGNVIEDKTINDFEGYVSKLSTEKNSVDGVEHTFFKLERYIPTILTAVAPLWTPIVDSTHVCVIKATLKDFYGKALANMEILCENDFAITDDKGVAQFLITSAERGENSYDIIFEGSDDYDSSNTNINIAVGVNINSNYNSVVDQYIAATFTFIFTKNVVGGGVPNLNITFNVQGKTYTGKTNSNGEVSFTHIFTKPGNFTFTVTGDYEISTTGTVTVNKNSIVQNVLKNNYNLTDNDYFIKNLVYNQNGIVSYDKLLIKDISSFDDLDGVIMNMEYTKGEWLFDTFVNNVDEAAVATMSTWKGANGVVVNLTYDGVKFEVDFDELK